MHPRTRRQLKKRKSALQELPLTPLIDTALTLLIIFMAATPVLQNAIKVTLPRGSAQENRSEQQDDLVIFIDKQGDFYIGTTKISKTDLIAQIKKIIGDDHEKTVYVKADTAISYGTVVELVDDIKTVGGIKYVALATQKHSQTTPSVG